MEKTNAFKEITESEKYKKTKDFLQHGTVSVFDHCLSVAETSLKISKVFHIGIDEESMVKTALLHDYFLYDWHDKNHPKLHGFRHAKIAAENAKRDFGLTEKEYKIICSHMFPLGWKLPLSREAIVLTLADKYCATKECFKRRGLRTERKNRKHANSL